MSGSVTRLLNFVNRSKVLSFFERDQYSIIKGKFRRQSCCCNNCGFGSRFEELQRVNHPMTYVKAQHVRKKKKKAGHRHTQRLQSAMNLVNVAQSPTNKKPKFRRHNTMVMKPIKQPKVKCKDDYEIKYEFFYKNELLLEERRLEEERIISYQQSCKKIGYRGLILDMGSSKSMESYSEDVCDPVQEAPPVVEFKISTLTKRKLIPIHSRRTTEGIIQVNNLSPNKTLSKYISQSTKLIVSPRLAPLVISPRKKTSSMALQFSSKKYRF